MRQAACAESSQGKQRYENYANKRASTPSKYPFHRASVVGRKLNLEVLAQREKRGNRRNDEACEQQQQASVPHICPAEEVCKC